jgi:hypothetical protein
MRGRGGGCAGEVGVGPAGGGPRPPGAHGARPPQPGRGARGRGARERERRRRLPPPPPGKVRGKWERLCTDGKTKKQRNPRYNNGGSHRGRRPLPEPRGNSLIAGDLGIQSTNRMRCDEALDETNAAVPSDSADDARIGSNCSPELEPPRTSSSNTGS